MPFLGSNGLAGGPTSGPKYAPPKPPPPRPSGISALSQLVARAAAPVEHVAHVVQHSAPERSASSARLASAVGGSGSRSSQPNRAAVGRLAAAMAARNSTGTLPLGERVMRMFNYLLRENAFTREFAPQPPQPLWHKPPGDYISPYDRSRSWRGWGATDYFNPIPLAPVGAGRAGRAAEQEIQGWRAGLGNRGLATPLPLPPVSKRNSRVLISPKDASALGMAPD